MKRLLIISLLFAGFCTAEAFTTREHATVAYIAEQHMTPGARANFYRAFGNKHLVEYASFPDFYRSIMKLKGNGIGHRVNFDANMQPIKNADPSKCNAYDGLLHAIGQLRNYKDLNDSTRIAAACMVIHFLGDSHCPSHINYADGRQKINTVRYLIYPGMNPKKAVTVNFHEFWDSWCGDQRYAGGYLDFAYQIDTCTPKEIKEIQKGSLEDWMHASAYDCKDLFDVKEGQIVDRVYVINKAGHLATQVRNAGYRLAALMNELFAK